MKLVIFSPDRLYLIYGRRVLVQYSKERENESQFPKVRPPRLAGWTPA